MLTETKLFIEDDEEDNENGEWEGVVTNIKKRMTEISEKNNKNMERMITYAVEKAFDKKETQPKLKQSKTMPPKS